MITTVPDHESMPRSVKSLWHVAQVHHRGILGPDAIMAAILGGGGNDARAALGLAVQEATEAELVDLMVEKVVTGAELHHLLAGLSRTGHIRRVDLVEWSEMFA